MAGAGGLKSRLLFEARSADGNGDLLGPWLPAFPSIAADITMLRGTEPVIAMRLQGIRPAAIRVRASAWTLSVTTDHRCVNTRNGEVFSIISVTADDTGAWVDVMAQTGGAPA